MRIGGAKNGGGIIIIIIIIIISGVGLSPLVLRPLLACCTSPR
jgi:hypothetical protein